MRRRALSRDMLEVARCCREAGESEKSLHQCFIRVKTLEVEHGGKADGCSS
jgi:hypothetical protein